MRAWTLAAVAALAWAGCTPKPAKLDVEPRKLHFTAAGDVVVLYQTLQDARGQPVRDVPCGFLSANSAIADVRQDGTVRAIGSGETHVTVTCGELKAWVEVKVSLPAKIVVEPVCKTRCTLQPGDPPVVALEGLGAKAQLGAQIFDSFNQPMQAPLEFVPAKIAESGQPSPVVSVTSSGEITAVAEGSTIVFVHAGKATGKVQAIVSLPVVDVITAPATVKVPLGQAASIGARPFRRTGRGLSAVQGVRLTYQSNKPRIAAVDEAGRVKGLQVGTADVLVAADSGAFKQVRIAVFAPRDASTSRRTATKRRR